MATESHDEAAESPAKSPDAPDHANLPVTPSRNTRPSEGQVGSGGEPDDERSTISRRAENLNVDDDDDDEDAEDGDEQEDEPKLKYHKLTANLTAVYRNGDATSSLLVGGDKMV